MLQAVNGTQSIDGFINHNIYWKMSYLTIFIIHVIPLDIKRMYKEYIKIYKECNQYFVTQALMLQL